MGALEAPGSLKRSPEEPKETTMAVPGGSHQSAVLDCTVFARVQACRIHDCTVFTRLQGPTLQKIQKNSMKNAGWEFIPGSPGSPGSAGNGGRRRGSEPPFHAQESQDDVSSQANSLKLSSCRSAVPPPCLLCYLWFNIQAMKSEYRTFMFVTKGGRVSAVAVRHRTVADAAKTDVV